MNRYQEIPRLMIKGYFMNRIKKIFVAVQSWDSFLLCLSRRGMHLQSSASLRQSVRIHGETSKGRAGAFDGFVVETEASCCCGGETDAALFSSSECCDQDCPCGAVDCDVSNCSNCTVKTCPKGCLEPGETCACSARCGKDPCKAECLPNPS